MESVYEDFMFFQQIKKCDYVSCSRHASIDLLISRMVLYTYHFTFRFDKRTVLAIHFVIEATCIAEVVTITIPSPKGC